MPGASKLIKSFSQEKEDYILRPELASPLIRLGVEYLGGSGSKALWRVRMVNILTFDSVFYHESGPNRAVYSSLTLDGALAAAHFLAGLRSREDGGALSKIYLEALGASLPEPVIKGVKLRLHECGSPTDVNRRRRIIQDYLVYLEDKK